MGCNCNGSEAVEKRNKLIRLNQELKTKIKIDMAKYTYKLLDSVAENTRLNFKGDKIPVKNISQAMLKLLYDNAHPQVDRVEFIKTKSEKKDDK